MLTGDLIFSARSKTHLRHLAFERGLELLHVRLRRFVTLLFRDDAETPCLIQIPISDRAIAERDDATDHRAGARDLVH